MRSSVVALAALVPALALGCHRSSSGPEPVPEPLVLNLGLPAVRIFGTGELRLVAASEEGAQRDLDGDGDLADLVLHLLDLETLALVNTGFAMLPPSPFPRDEVPPPELTSSDALAVLVVSELATGFDANGNGIANEVTSWVFNGRTGQLRPLPFLHARILLGGDLGVFLTLEDGDPVLKVLDGRDDSLVTLPILEPSPLLVRDDFVVFLAPESDLVDLNLDGDRVDPAVLQIYDAGARRLVNAAWATSSVRWAGGFVGFSVREADQGGTDLDGDGDAGDHVFLALDPATGLVRNPGLSGALFADGFGESGSFLLVASEGAIGDRNGDGDDLDSIFLTYDPVADRLVDSRLATRGLLAASGRWVGVAVSEAAQGFMDLDGERGIGPDVLFVVDTLTGSVQNLRMAGFWIDGFDGHLLALRDEFLADWNGDGDRGDLVLFDWSGRARAAANAAIVIGATFGAAGETALVTVLEAYQGVDLDGDGDQLDFVLALYDARARSTRNLGLPVVTGDALLDAEGRAPALASEQAQGADLSGDGDLLDDVLHVIDIAPENPAVVADG